MSEQGLMKYFKFDEADRLANQAGKITEKQKVRFRTEDQYNKKWSRIGSIILLALAAFGLVFMLYAWRKYSSDMSIAIVDITAGGIWTLVWGIIGGYVLSRLSSRTEFIVSQVQGHARIADVQSSYANNRVGLHQELHIGGKRFVATRMLAGCMPEGDYIVYYFDRPAKNPAGITYPYASEDILSVDLLKKDNATPAPETTSDHEAKDAEMVACLKKNDEAGAIRRHRSLNNSSFEEAKKSVEILKAKLKG